MTNSRIDMTDKESHQLARHMLQRNNPIAGAFRYGTGQLPLHTLLLVISVAWLIERHGHLSRWLSDDRIACSAHHKGGELLLRSGARDGSRDKVILKIW
jgi:hypothetical protein